MSSDIPDYWKKNVKLRNGTKVLLRPEKKSDLPMLKEMFNSLSNDSKQFLTGEITEEMIESWIKALDYDKILPIVGVHEESPDRILGAAVLSFYELDAYKHKTTFDITVRDDLQNQGLGTLLTLHMIDVTRRLGLKKVSLKVHTDNERAIHVYKKCGFHIEGKLEIDHWNYITGEYGDQYQMALLL
jgi:diamine N-acetyltransferase